MPGKTLSQFKYSLLLLAISFSVQLAGQENPIHAHGQHQAGESMDMEIHDHSAMGHEMSSLMTKTGTAFSTDVTSLPDALAPETIILNDGDSLTLTAAYVKKKVGNRTLRMLAYNRSVPGPFIKVSQDSEILITLKNETDFEQTLHSHGVRVNNLYDGVPGVTQNAVAPGETFVYKLKFSDAGMFWYHPHTREDYGQELGLYGNYLINPSKDGYWNPVNREVPLIIDDILIDNGKIADFYREYTNFALLGRFGNEYLVNGEKDFSLNVTKGEVIRFYVTNVSNTRSYNLSIPGIQFKIAGGDLGKYEHEMFSSSFLISPAERVVLEAIFTESGTYTLTHTQPDKKVTLTKFVVANGEQRQTDLSSSFYTLRHNQDVIDEFKNYRMLLNSQPDKTLKMTIKLEGQDVDHNQHAHSEMGEQDHSQHDMESMEIVSNYQSLSPSNNVLQTMQWDDPMQSDRTNVTPEIFWQLVDTDTGKVSMDINDWTFKENDLVKIRLINDKNADHIMQHPIHFHGQQFVVLSVDGLPNNNLVWKDTALVFPGQTVDLLVKMSNTGEWMLHCHISEHLHAGMKMKFRVENDDNFATGDEYRATLPAINMDHTH